MGRPKKFTDEKLLEGARECLLKNGPTVSTAVIAKCIGVSQAALFKRFQTKENLMIAALKPPMNPAWHQVLIDGPDDREVKTQVAQIVRLLNGHIESVVPLVEMLHAAGIDPHQHFKKNQTAPPVLTIKLLAGWFRRAQAKGLIRKTNPTSLAYGLLGAVHSRLFIERLSTDRTTRISSRTHQAAVIDVLINGITPEVEQ
jgi:AcrR family transcriptional regulator